MFEDLNAMFDLPDALVGLQALVHETFLNDLALEGDTLNCAMGQHDGGPHLGRSLNGDDDGTPII